MIHNKEIKKWINVYIATALFWFAAHAFCFLNTLHSDDSLAALYQKTDNEWQISLGRFLHPVYRAFRGQLTAPFLIGLLSLLWLSMAVFVVVKLLNIESAASMVLICGVLATNATVTLTNATYMHQSDMATLALLFSVLGVYACCRYRFGFLAGAVFISMSLALYQSYLSVSVVLFLTVLIKMLIDGSAVIDVFTRGAKALCSLLGGLGLYYLVFQLVLWATGISASTDYNSITGVGDYSGVSLPRLLFDTYVYPVRYFLDPKTYNRPISVVATGLIAILAAAGLAGLIITKRMGKKKTIMMLALLAFFPFGANVTYFISKGLIHTLMIFSFFFLYVFAILIAEYYTGDKGESGVFLKPKVISFMKKAAFVFMAVLIFNNIVYSNQIYLRKELEYQSTLSVMTRIIDRLEQTEGYVVGETPVAVIGRMQWSPLSQKRLGFEDVYGVGIGDNFSVTNGRSVASYFHSVLGYPINLADSELRSAYGKRDEFLEMPKFPDAGSIRYIDDVLVVKIANP